MNSRTLNDELTFAHTLADAADAITLPRFGAADLDVGFKADATHVTDADTGSERAMRDLLATHRPDHAVLGEEEGLIGDPAAAFRWIIDPIDGTANYVRGVPIWATLIALQHDGDTVVAVVSAPALGRRWWATAGGGAFVAPTGQRDGRRLSVSAVDTLDRCHLGHASTGGWAAYGRGPQFAALCEQVWRSRGLGDFWMHCLVAEGAFDVAVEPIVSLWDLASVDLVVREAGGTFTNLDGLPGPDGASAISSNGLLHDTVLAALAVR